METRSRFTGRRVLITGGGSGIGRAAALRFAREGASVAVAGRRTESLEETALLAERTGGTILHRSLDVSDAEAVDVVVDEVAGALGEIDTLVNNAGVAGPNACSRPGPDRWREIVGTNLDGAFYVTRACLRHMPDGGRILNVSSVLGKFGIPDHTAYCASKLGLVGFTRALAVELAPRRITVNAVCPGWVDTPMARAGMEQLAKEWGVEPGEARARALADVPVQRILQPDEIAGFLVWLASEEAGGMTGQAVNHCGGQAMW